MLGAVKDISEYSWITEEDISDPEWSPIVVDGGCGGSAVVFTMAVIGAC